MRNIKDKTQATDEQYYELLKFKSPDDVIKLLKVVMTRQMFNHWEARDDSEKQKMARGAANICKTILDAHRMVMLIENEEKQPEKKMDRWKQFKKKFKVS